MRTLEQIKAYHLQWQRNNRAKQREYQIRRLAKNPDAGRIANRAWYARNKQSQIERRRKYYIANRLSIIASAKRRMSNMDAKRRRNEYARNQRATKINVAIKERLSKRIASAFVYAGSKKNKSTVHLIGCSIEFFKGYLEARFKDGMSWENRSKWHIDHRIPCAEFDLTDPDQQRQCFHYSNMQPLWAAHNVSKHDSIPEPHQAELI